MRALAAKGADPRLAAKDKTTPLIMAAGLGERLCGLDLSVGRPVEGDVNSRVEAVKLAVELGADANAANDMGLTALHAAAFMGSDEVIRLLVGHNATVDAKDKYGQTPLSIAEKDILPGLLDLLKPQDAHKSTAALLRKLGAHTVATQDAELTRAAP
jgi:ankyrin repeat protein